MTMLSLQILRSSEVFQLRLANKAGLKELCKALPGALSWTGFLLKSGKICEDLKMCEPKPSIISQQSVVYNYKCDLCDAEYLHQRIFEHR